MGKGSLDWLLGAGLCSSLASCAEPPGAARIVGPDGTRMLHVHCAADQVACFQIAGERCPHGYDLSPIFDPHDGNFLVRCRAPQMAPVVASASQPRSGSAAANIDRWPPAEVGTPSEPWPTHASSDLPPAPRSASGTIDLGY